MADVFGGTSKRAAALRSHINAHFEQGNTAYDKGLKDRLVELAKLSWHSDVLAEEWKTYMSRYFEISPREAASTALVAADTDDIGARSFKAAALFMVIDRFDSIKAESATYQHKDGYYDHYLFTVRSVALLSKLHSPGQIHAIKAYHKRIGEIAESHGFEAAFELDRSTLYLINEESPILRGVLERMLDYVDDFLEQGRNFEARRAISFVQTRTIYDHADLHERALDKIKSIGMMPHDSIVELRESSQRVIKAVTI